MKTPINIFVSYSSKDRELRDLLEDGLRGHLAQRSNFEYQTWTDRQIDLGADWQKEIEKALDKANVALLLVSANFIASDYINNQELPYFFSKQQQGKMLILPIMVRQVAFQSVPSLSKLNFFKTYYPEYGFNKPIERKKLLPFDKLAEDANTTDAQLNDYFAKLANFIHTAVANQFGVEKMQETKTPVVENTSKPTTDIRLLIASGKLQKAVAALLKATEGKSEYNDIILQSGRLNRVLNDERQGIIRGEDASRTKNQITHALLSYLDDLEL